MIRGTTPTVTYNFPFNVTDLVKFRMYFIQGTETVLEKTEEDCIFSGTTVKVMLTQEETYKFSPKKKLITRARFKDSDDNVGGTKPKEIRVEGNDSSGSEVL